MVPSQLWETREVSICRDQGAAVFNCNRRMLRVGNELSGNRGRKTKSFQNFQMIRSGCDYPRLWTLHQ